MIRIIGIGSPFGDDAAGIEIARILTAAPPPNCEVIAADRPGVDLVEMLDGADAAILIDAVRSGAAPGTVHEFAFSELERCPVGFVSSHDLDVIAAIQLAHVLGRAPRRGRVIGIEIGRESDGRKIRPLCSAVTESIGSVIERVRECARELDDRERWRFVLAGTVQGVGLRPFVWRLARSLGMAGFVRNFGAGVEIEIEGSPAAIRDFRRRLVEELPPAAAVDSVEGARVRVRDERDFVAMASERGRAAATIPPDLAICVECAEEIANPKARRFRYPFTNCTACGPRFTVVQALPYDRVTTTLAGFPLCAECEREYLDPADRRFRAEPIACPRCGPRARIEIVNSGFAGDGADDPVARAAAIVRAGGVVAVMGLGGIHLACDAGNEAAVARIRALKRRPHKPFAVMVDSAEAARRMAFLGPEEEALLASAAAPIVLAPKRPEAPIAARVAPGNDHVGVMLAYSPMHRLLAGDAGRPLVMTSANLPGEPLAMDGAEVRAAFGDGIDAILLHDRPIHQRCDDGVWMIAVGGAQPVRLGRGNTPRPIEVPIAATQPILGVGGDIKNCFCILDKQVAMMSQHIGSLENIATEEHFRTSLTKWSALAGVEPAIVAHDLHPDSHSRRIASSLGLPTIGVQHHHAHIAACLAENNHRGPAIGIAFDGTGYGPDGTIWGGEAMVADYGGFRRIAHLKCLPLAGGDSAIRSPARIAAAFLLGAFGSMFADRARRMVGDSDASIIARMVERGINTIPTSSCGRLFDAVAAMIGVCGAASYEAQAAIEMEALARSAPQGGHIYPVVIRDGIVSTSEIFAAIVGDLVHSTPPALIARAFHDTMAEIVMRMASLGRAETGIDTVALSGGCFQNRLLLDASVEKLRSAGFTVMVHRRVPANDGGLALGQAVVAAAILDARHRGG